MTPKEQYEKRKRQRNARKEHLSDQEARELDHMDLFDRLVTSFETIGDGLQKLAAKQT